MISQQCVVENVVLRRGSFIHQHPDAFMMMWRDNPNIALIYCSLELFLLTITGTDGHRTFFLKSILIQSLPETIQALIYKSINLICKALILLKMVQARLHFTDG